MNQTTITPDQVINTLNDLIELNRNGQSGFEEAAEKIKSPQIKAFCLEQSLSRAQFVAELQSQLRSMGIEPNNAGSVAGVLHRVWIDLKSALGGGDHAILVAMETSEDHAANEYTRALTEPLPVPARDMVERQLQSVRQTLNKVKELRGSMDK